MSPPIHFILKTLSVFSLKQLYLLADLIAVLINNTPNQISRQCRENIAMCFPEFSAKQQQQLVADAVRHTCYSLIELAFIWYKPVDQVIARTHTSATLAQFTERQKAQIIIVPHHGSWEMANYWLAHQGDVYSLYKPQRNPATDQWILQRRTRNGAHLVSTRQGGLRQLMKALKSGKRVMVLPDQRPGKKQAQVEGDFFAHPAATSLLVKNLAQRIDCEIYLAAAIRNLADDRYDLHVELLKTDAVLAEDQQSAQYLNQKIEQLVGLQLCQYQWGYRRFTEAAYQAYHS